MIVGILKEIKPEENRVAMTPAGVEVMRHNGHQMLVEKGAGAASGFPDDAYAGAGAEIIETPREIFERARDEFDVLYEEGKESARIMCVSVHPYVTGAAHRIKYLEKIVRYVKEHDDVLIMRGEEILDWYNEAVAS